MRVMTGFCAMLLVATATPAQEQGTESLESLFEELGRLFETTIDHVTVEAGELAGRLDHGEPLDQTLSLTLEVTGHDEVSVLTATSHFFIESEENSMSTSDRDDEESGEHSHSRLELAGSVHETTEDGEYLIQYRGHFESESRSASGSDSDEREEDETGRLEFQGSAKLSMGEDRVLASRGRYKVVLFMTEAD